MPQSDPKRELAYLASVQIATQRTSHASPEEHEPIWPCYLVAIALGAAIWAGFSLAFIWIVDPYGISPVHLGIAGFNILKPKRVDIDQLIKPYEVWRYQPRTVFMGTSRINKSFDPTALDGSRFAPAYNAAIPANEINDVYSDLEQYFRLDRKLHTVFLEVFFYNFSRAVAPIRHKDVAQLEADITALMFSETALRDSAATIVYNIQAQPNTIPAHTAPRGFWVPPTWFNTADRFNAQLFIETIIRIHGDIPDLQMQPSAFAALDRIVELCAKHQADLYLIITPNYPWDDYRLLALGYWSRLADFYRKLSHYPNVVSFSQYNAPLTEAPGRGMRYWYDPIHFSATTGRMMLHALIGAEDTERPENFVRPISPETVEVVLAERREGLKRWIAANHEFAEQFDAARDAAHEKGVSLKGPYLNSNTPQASAITK